MMTAVAFEIAQLDAYERHCELEVNVEVRRGGRCRRREPDASGHALLFDTYFTSASRHRDRHSHAAGSLDDLRAFKFLKRPLAGGPSQGKGALANVFIMPVHSGRPLINVASQLLVHGECTGQAAHVTF